jgi:wyosine [tRNA(Phe)-imidazoG37] synthetase (radical SAM superfamily)
MTYLFGPVPSRRLGLSLGVDLLPYKTCTLDCAYCQLGRTTCLTLERKKRVPPQEVLREIASRAEDKFDYLTLSGSGEPTLHADLDEIIGGARDLTDRPIAVLTNGTLFTIPKVREETAEADLIIPSLDAATQATFQRVNRPHPNLKIVEIIQGLIDLRKEFSGEIWLEVMLVKGLNDEEVEKIAEAAQRIGPDKVQLNTVIRPPADPVQPLSPKEMNAVMESFPGAEIIADWGRKTSKEKKVQILDMLTRRPCTLDEMSTLTNLHRNEILKYLEVLERDEKIVRRRHGGVLYFQALEPKKCDS